VFQHTETSTRFYKAITTWNSNGWTTKLADGSEIRFPESYNAKNLAQGAATVMIDAKGNHLELRHDPQRNLQEIRTPQGHWIRFAYDDQSRIKRAKDAAGQLGKVRIQQRWDARRRDPFLRSAAAIWIGWRSDDSNHR
jgi:YD repeat-containing protein